MTCSWTKVEIKDKGILDLLKDAVTPTPEPPEGEKEKPQAPGALNSGWEDYYQWANKEHSEWSAAFQKAECERIAESKRWLEFYYKVYNDDWGFMKKLVMFALNAVQIWALWKQFRQQKEIADRTYEIADRQQQIAEQLYNYYEKTYQPHEKALSDQINEVFTSRSVEYDDVANRFGSNTAIAFARAKANLVRCSSAHCQSFSANMMKQMDIEASQSIGNARTGAYRWAELMKESRDTFFLEMRMKFIQIGRNVSSDGQQGIMKAFGTFSSFGADPGAALSQLLSTFSNTMGQMLNTPVAPTGQVPQMPLVQRFEPWIRGVRQSGDIQVGKASISSVQY